MQTENIGWQCPNCLVVYAPNVNNCSCGVIPILTKDEFKAYSGVLNSKDWNDFVVKGSMNVSTAVNSSTTYICSGYISKTGDGICDKCAKPKWSHYNLTNI